MDPKRSLCRWLAASSLLAAFALLAGSAHAATCTLTGFQRDGINLTAAMIAPPGETNYSGVTVAATGCNVGIYFGPGTSGSVDSSEVSGANYFGILVAGDNDELPGSGAASVDVTSNSVHDIGENPFNGTQHGVGIYYRAVAAGSSATGTISGNTVTRYQKGGITANGAGAAASISSNTVNGLGPVVFIAQNGIQIGFGGSGQIMRNTVTANSYTGSNFASSAGVLIFGGCGSPLTTGIQVVKNTIGSSTPADGNDIGIAAVNYDVTCSVAQSSPTNIKTINNSLINDEQTNTTGGGALPYQAGISDNGVNDKLINNSISGIGYTGSGPSFFAIDTSGSSAAKVHANSFAP